jgi:hypothetical protein
MPVTPVHSLYRNLLGRKFPTHPVLIESLTYLCNFKIGRCRPRIQHVAVVKPEDVAAARRGWSRSFAPPTHAFSLEKNPFCNICPYVSGICCICERRRIRAIRCWLSSPSPPLRVDFTSIRTLSRLPSNNALLCSLLDRSRRRLSYGVGFAASRVRLASSCRDRPY